MADPELDSGIVVDQEGRTDIPNSTFFDVGFGGETTVEEYIDRIIFPLSEAIEEHLLPQSWSITTSTNPPEPTTQPKDGILIATCLAVASLSVIAIFLR